MLEWKKIFETYLVVDICHILDKVDVVSKVALQYPSNDVHRDIISTISLTRKIALPGMPQVTGIVYSYLLPLASEKGY